MCGSSISTLNNKNIIAFTAPPTAAAVAELHAYSAAAAAPAMIAAMAAGASQVGYGWAVWACHNTLMAWGTTGQAAVQSYTTQQHQIGQLHR